MSDTSKDQFICRAIPKVQGMLTPGGDIVPVFTLRFTVASVIIMALRKVLCLRDMRTSRVDFFGIEFDFQ